MSLWDRGTCDVFCVVVMMMVVLMVVAMVVVVAVVVVVVVVVVSLCPEPSGGEPDVTVVTFSPFRVCVSLG